VAVPLRWEDLGGIERPDAFDLAKARARAARLRKDPWDGFHDLRPPRREVAGWSGPGTVA
jgi:bifunctional non-homologous end joining protein LigD